MMPNHQNMVAGIFVMYSNISCVWVSGHTNDEFNNEMLTRPEILCIVVFQTRVESGIVNAATCFKFLPICKVPTWDYGNQPLQRRRPRRSFCFTMDFLYQMTDIVLLCWTHTI